MEDGGGGRRQDGSSWLFTWDRSLNPNNNPNEAEGDVIEDSTGGGAPGPGPGGGTYDGSSAVSESHFYDAESNLFPARDEDALAIAMRRTQNNDKNANEPQDIMDLGNIVDDDDDDDDDGNAEERETQFMLGLQGKTGDGGGGGDGSGASAQQQQQAGSNDDYLTRVAALSEARKQKKRRRAALILFVFVAVPSLIILAVVSNRQERRVPGGGIPLTPTISPAPTVSIQPTTMPSLQPTHNPTSSTAPSMIPSVTPTFSPSVSFLPTQTPTLSVQPSHIPSPAPTRKPVVPSEMPSVDPTSAPTRPPSLSRLDCSAWFASFLETAAVDTNTTNTTTATPGMLVASPLVPLSHLYNVTTYSRTTTMVDLWTADENDLCMLVETDGVRTWKPMARSYQGHAWEAYRTRNAPSLSSIVCEGDVETMDHSKKQRVCSISLPRLGSNKSFYALVPRSLNHSPQLSHIARNSRNLYARFLEQATMGTNPDEIEFLQTVRAQSQQEETESPVRQRRLSSLSNHSRDDDVTMETGMDPMFPIWMQLQMDTIKPSSHRVFWRHHATARALQSSPAGTVTHPCDAQATYRKFTFTNLHMGQFLQITTYEPAPDHKLLAINDVVLTIIDGAIQFENQVGQIPRTFPDGQYKFCRSPENFVGGAVYLHHPEEPDCKRRVLFGKSSPGNPPVLFYEPVLLPPRQVKLSKGNIFSLDDEYYATRKTPKQRLLTLAELDDPSCPPAFNEGNEAPIVMGRLTLENGKDDYWIHDPRYLLNQNSLEHPLNDGGHSIMTQTQSDNTNLRALCANVPRTFQNEASCVLSGVACAPTGKVVTQEQQRGVVVCGSPGEEANKLSNDGEINRGAFDLNVFNRYTGEGSSTNTLKDSQTIWMAIVLTAPDQLRQRTAWALSQMLGPNVDSLSDVRTESVVHFYDIFVRNAFGNYRTILKEAVYSPIMARLLNYRNSQSLGFRWRKNEAAGKDYPDENLARVMMQLFTIGMYELNDDGTYRVDKSSGGPIETYSSDDIKEYARVWTGFREQFGRGNKDDPLTNQIDPMDIEVSWRDVFPKMGLAGKYVGDGYPLCADRPDQHFLKRGAKYVLLGYSPMPELQVDPASWGSDPEANRFVADPAGQLRSVLCGADANSNCWYPPVVTLTEDLQCFGEECDVETIRVVKVKGGVFYEYVPVPCVHHTYYKNPQQLKKGFRTAGAGTARMCADPRTTAGSTACCLDGGTKANAHEPHYWGERVKASVAQTRCADLVGETMCTSGRVHIQNCNTTFCEGTPYYWMSPRALCRLKAKFDDSGRIAVVHELPGEDETKRERGYEEEDNQSFFRVHYFTGGEMITDLVSTCDSISGCSVSLDARCMCDINVSEEQVFSSIPSAKDEILSILTVGSFHPDILDGSYTKVTVGEVTMYSLNGVFSDQTVFEVVDDFGVIQLRRNILSVVQVGSTSITFRNPVQFMSLSEPTLRDAQHEVDAAIDHFVFHKNTAPFLAMRLAQRFGTSNPSLRYVKAIASAFQTGTYHHREGNVTFGEGSYGDMGATAAAILLDREARCVVLDADPVHGSLKEPVLKLTGLMRNLEYQPTPQFPYPRFFKDMQDAIGQMVYQAPDIFSFFNPQFQPDSAVAADAGMVSPEAQVHTTSNVIGIMNGLLAMIKYGLDRCFDGFGETLNWVGKQGCQSRVAGKYVDMSSKPMFVPKDPSSSANIVDELSTVMTSGRLSPQHRDMIMDVLADEVDPLLHIVKAEQLIMSTAEFHSTGTPVPGAPNETLDDSTQPPAKSDSSKPAPYKALVVLMLAGGCDSYNLLVPHTCSKTNDEGLSVLDEYLAERGELALNKSERSLEINVEGQQQKQPCESFAVHYRLPFLQELYNQGDLSFFLNAGMINQIANNNTWNAVTTTKLFDSNSMLTEAQQIDPYNRQAPTGVLARLAQMLNSDAYGFHTQTFSFDKLHLAVKGDGTNNGVTPVVVNGGGPQIFNERPSSEDFDPLDSIEQLNGFKTKNDISSSLFGNLWSRSLMRALDENKWVTSALSNATLSDDIVGLGVQLMQTRRERGNDRDLFYVQMGGWDHRSDTKARTDKYFGILDDEIRSFVNKVKEAGLWENVTLLVLSESGRTLEPSNHENGTGYGWAGHYFALGGALKGGNVFGKYPSQLTVGPWNAGAGIMIPTLSWESIWFPMSEWLGVTRKDLDTVFPNGKGTGTTLLTKGNLFEAGL